jgi:hypothetical protein
MGQRDKTIERVLPVSNRPLQHNDINVGNKRSQRGQHVDARNGQGLGLLPNDDQLLVPTMDAVTHPNKRLHGGGGQTVYTAYGPNQIRARNKAAHPPRSVPESHAGHCYTQHYADC